MLSLNDIYQTLCMGMLNPAYDNREYINRRAVELIEKEDLTQDEVNDLGTLIKIGNITYDNLDVDLLPIDETIYDLMIMKYKKHNQDYPVGSKPVHFETNPSLLNSQDEEKEPLMIRMGDNEIKYHSDMIYPELMNNLPRRSIAFESKQVLDVHDGDSKKMRDTPHNHPTLVGT